jgi:predicted nucleic acid-binding protein
MAGGSVVSEFVDTNVFVRVLARDDPAKTAASLALFKRAEQGGAALVTSEAIVAEIVYVLSSKDLYKLGRADVVRLLKPMLDNRGLRIDRKSEVLAALDLYETSRLDFEDCLAVVHAGRQTKGRIYSYDRGFDRAPGVQRLEPRAATPVSSSQST